MRDYLGTGPGGGLGGGLGFGFGGRSGAGGSATVRICVLGLGGKGGCGGVGVGGSGGNGGRGGSGSGLLALAHGRRAILSVYLIRNFLFLTSQEQDFNVAQCPKNWISINCYLASSERSRCSTSGLTGRLL